MHHFGLETFPPSPNDDYPPLFTGIGLRWTEGDRVPTPRTEPGNLRKRGRPACCSTWADRRHFRSDTVDQAADDGGEEALCRATKDCQGTRENKTGTSESNLNCSHLTYACSTALTSAQRTTEIGAVLFRNQSKEQRLIYVRDYWGAAIKLRDKDYLFIAAGDDTAPRLRNGRPRPIWYPPVEISRRVVSQ